MAAVTAQAFVHIPADLPVFFVHCGSRMGVTVQATEDRIVGGVRMAVIARCPFTRVGAGVNRKLVRDSSSSPRRRRVAGCTRFGEAGGNMVRIGYRVVFAAVTGIAIRGCSGITAANVAACTLDRRMRTRQCEPCSVVIEYGAQPLRRRVA
jgi:hypothetical protein